MIRQSARTGRTSSTSCIQREVIQAQGHSGSNQNCTSSSWLRLSCHVHGSNSSRTRIPVAPFRPGFAADIASELRRSYPDSLWA